MSELTQLLMAAASVVTPAAFAVVVLGALRQRR